MAELYKDVVKRNTILGLENQGYRKELKDINFELSQSKTHEKYLVFAVTFFGITSTILMVLI